MPPNLTEAQALALIPDYGSRTRGQKLADPKTWTQLGCDELSAWGECAGSGKTPYLVAAGLTEAASKCSCPSPDKPCKHAAGLLLLYAKQPELFTAPSPDKLTAWHSARRQHAAREARQGQPRDPALQAAALAGLEQGVDAKRQARMVAGAAELAAVLEDLVQQGLAATHPDKPALWEPRAQRLVDNQLPSLATAVRELPELAGTPERLLARLGELYLLARACQNLPALPPAARQEVLQQVGVTFRREDLLDAYEPVADEWLVLEAVEGGNKDEWGNRISPTRRTWLYGTGTGRYAMLYEFAFGHEWLPDALPPGSRRAGSLVYYPGLLPLRAAWAQPPVDPGPAGPLVAPAGQSIGQLLAGYAAAIGRAPWLRQWPVTLTGVRPATLADGRRALHHPAENLTVPLLRPQPRWAYDDGPDHYWLDLLGNTLEGPCTVFGEWDGRQLHLLYVWPLEQPTPADLPARGATAPTGNGYGAPWPALVQAATVGTHRATLPELPGLPPAAAPAQRLLLAVGTAALLQKTGYESPADATPLLPPAAPEPWPQLGPTGAALLEQAPGLLEADYLRLLREHQLRVPPRLVLPLLRGRAYPELYHAQVLGKAGAWLIQQNKKWRDAFKEWNDQLTPARQNQPWDSWSQWRPGCLPLPRRRMQNMGKWVDKNVEQVRDYLRWLHHSDPEAARPLFVEALAFADKLTSYRAYNLMHILDAFDQNLTPEEAAITEPYLMQPNEHEEDFYKTVREPLLRMPGSPLRERLWARAGPLLTVQRPAGGPQELKVKFPKSWDATWQADAIEAPGRASKEEGGKWGPQLWQLLALLPVRRWTAELNLTVPELLALAAAHAYGPSLLQAWDKADELYPDREVTEHLLLHQLRGHFGPDVRQQVSDGKLARLNRDEQLDLARRYLPAHPTASHLLPLVLTRLAGGNGAPWPPDLAAALLDNLRAELLPAVTGAPNDLPAHWLDQMTRLVGASSVVPEELLSRYAVELPGLVADFPLAAQSVQQMLAGITLRQRMLASLANPAA